LIMKRIFFKLSIAAIPTLFIISIYIVYDPFKVLYHHDSYYTNEYTLSLPLNKDVVTTEMFIENYAKYHYDSYIFGNSRAMYYAVGEWEKHIHSTNCYHFEAWGESLFGVEKKMEFIHNKGLKIKNALFIIDSSILNTVTNYPQHLFIKDPETSGESKLVFQSKFIVDYFDGDFLKEYYYFLLTHKISPYTRFFYSNIAEYNPMTNEVGALGLEQKIKNNPDSFYQSEIKSFYKRNPLQHYTRQLIGDKQKAYLLKIKEMLAEDHSDYRIVINPLYDQDKIDSSDLKYLYDIFGRQNVFNFSGINDMTQSIYNYYEVSHYRCAIANRIMDSIYKK